MLSALAGRQSYQRGWVFRDFSKESRGRRDIGRGANATGDNLVTSGNGSSRVGVGFFCGAQALGFGIARPASFKRKKEDDYEHQNGVGITMKHDIKKTFYNLKQHGMVTHFHSAAADS